MTLSGSAIFDFYFPYKLQPIAAEVYGTKESEFSLGTLKPQDCVVAVE